MSEPFLTISQNTSFEMTIKKSRFICTLARIKTEDEAQQLIAQVSANNRKANHNCFAYMIGDRDQVQRESDDGEPSGTAGVPILEALQLAKIHNVIAIVTRYFGGIKLGAGGLIRAYSNVTTEAIHQAGFVQRVKQTTLTITSSYAQHNQLTYYLKEHHIQIADEQYAVDVTTSVYVDQDRLAALINDLTNQFNDQLTMTKGAERYNEVPYKQK